jgi:predicted DNA-binding transcriptional regulator AlpA
MPLDPKTYSFTLILSVADGITQEVEDALFEAGCDDALLGSRNGVLFLDFDREADSMEAAIISAIRDVRKAGLGVQRVEQGEAELVTAGEIARRLGRSRETVRLYAQGRRGPGGFPPPVAGLKSRSPVYRWSEISAWTTLTRATTHPESEHDTGLIDLINSSLTVYWLAPQVPRAAEVLRALGTPLEKPSSRVRRTRKKTTKGTI